MVAVRRDVFAVVFRIAHQAFPSTHGGHGRDEASALGHGLGAVGPEVESVRQGRTVLEPNVRVDPSNVRGEPDLYGPPHPRKLLVRADHDRRRAVVVLPDVVIHRRERQRVVADGEVELDAACYPRAAQGYQSWLDDRRSVEHVPARDLVERIEVSAEFRQHVDAEKIILEDECLVLDVSLLVGKIVEHGVRIYARVAPWSSYRRRRVGQPDRVGRYGDSLATGEYWFVGHSAEGSRRRARAHATAIRSTGRNPVYLRIRRADRKWRGAGKYY